MWILTVLIILPFIIYFAVKRWPKLADKLEAWTNPPFPAASFDFWKENPVPVVIQPISDGERRELTTCPPDGFIVIIRMNYGQSLARQTMGTKMSLGGTSKDEFSGELDIDQKAIALYDFANCIIDHNLTDQTGRKLNFKDANDVSRLPRAVGEEIGKLIDEINDVEQSDDTKE